MLERGQSYMGQAAGWSGFPETLQSGQTMQAVVVLVLLCVELQYNQFCIWAY